MNEESKGDNMDPATIKSAIEELVRLHRAGELNYENLPRYGLADISVSPDEMNGRLVTAGLRVTLVTDDGIIPT